MIAPGRFYVDGILCENDAEPAKLLAQPDLPGAALPTAAGSYAVYLDVWERHITAGDQRADGFHPLREAALGGADTASRVRVVWQAKLASVASKSCGAFKEPAPPTGSCGPAKSPAGVATNDCLVPTSGGYRRLENQLYRVEVSQSPQPRRPSSGRATTPAPRAGSRAAIRRRDDRRRRCRPRRCDRLRRREVRRAERRNADVERDRPGSSWSRRRVRDVDPREEPANASLALGTNPILRRWDGVGDVKANTPTEVEDGVQIEFDGGTFVVGDYWLIPARTLTGRVEWPRTGTTSVFEAPHGIVHCYAALAVVSFTGTAFDQAVTDCRKLFPPLTAITAKDVSYDPSECANLKGTSTVQQALDVLCQGTGGGENEDGIHVKGIFLPSGAPLLNDKLFVPGDLLKGLRIDCDEQLFDGSVVNKNGLPNPVCSLTLDVPWPLRGDERQFWGIDGGTFVGYTPVLLAAEVTAKENAITWMPLPPTQKWLNDRLLQMYTEMTNEQNPRVLARLKLAGNFIWGPQRTPKLRLDGELFGDPRRRPRRCGVSERQRPGRWRSPHVVLAGPPAAARSGHRVVHEPNQQIFRGDDAISARRWERRLSTRAGPIQPNMRAVLPPGYELDATQRFNPTEAAGLARRSG